MKRILFLALSFLLLYGCAGTPNEGFDEVVIESTPPGALVILNGAEHGRTPLGLTLASNQNHTLVFQHSDYPMKALELHRHLIPAMVSIQVLFSANTNPPRIGSGIAPGEDLTVVYSAPTGKEPTFTPRRVPPPAVEAPKPIETPVSVEVESPPPADPPAMEVETKEVTKEKAEPAPPKIERCTRCRRTAVTGSKYCEVHGA